jgi:hypothetical protein
LLLEHVKIKINIRSCLLASLSRGSLGSFGSGRGDVTRLLALLHGLLLGSGSSVSNVGLLAGSGKALELGADANIRKTLDDRREKKTRRINTYPDGACFFQQVWWYVFLPSVRLGSAK